MLAESARHLELSSNTIEWRYRLFEILCGSLRTPFHRPRTAVSIGQKL